MDSALSLRLKWENREKLSDFQIAAALGESGVVRKLTASFVPDRLFAVFRLLGISEIPYGERLPYTVELLQYIDENMATSEGFCYLGSIREIVPCYNAMLLEAYVRLGRGSSEAVKNALNWVKRYQLFERGQKSLWPHDGICRYGGCLNATPCYIGVAKSVRALITYQEYAQGQDPEIDARIAQGVAYMLRHKLYRRLSDGEPISRHITDIMFPQSYVVSVTDLVYIAGKQGLAHRPEAEPLMDLLQRKQVEENQWKLDYIYSHKGYVSFETKRKPSSWISALFPLWLMQTGETMEGRRNSDCNGKK